MGVDWPHYCWVELKVLTLQYASSEPQQRGAKALHHHSLLLIGMKIYMVLSDNAWEG